MMPTLRAVPSDPNGFGKTDGPFLDIRASKSLVNHKGRMETETAGSGRFVGQIWQLRFTKLLVGQSGIDYRLPYSFAGTVFR